MRKYRGTYTPSLQYLKQNTKMAPSKSRSKSRNRHVPLEDDILKTGILKSKSNKRKSRTETEDGYVDSRSSRKILKIGQDLADEEQQERVASAPNPAFAFESRFDEGDASEEGDTRFDDEEAWGDEEEEVVEEVVSLKYL